jgi:splicing factor U2AF subunit
MAHHLGKVFGTEEDKVNCSYYFKIGACRHGDGCGRKHIKPLVSQTLLLPHIYTNPMVGVYTSGASIKVPPEEAERAQRAYEETWVDIFDEVSKYGEVHELEICDNLGDHMVRGLRMLGEGGCGRAAPLVKKNSRPPPPPPSTGGQRVREVL